MSIEEWLVVYLTDQELGVIQTRLIFREGSGQTWKFQVMTFFLIVLEVFLLGS